MPASQYLGNLALQLLPPTRSFGVKRGLLRFMGVRISNTARVTKGVQVLGTLDLSIGRDTFIGHEVLICGGDSKVTIGDRVDIAPRVILEAGGHVIDMPSGRAAGEGVSHDIVIEDGAWIGAGVTVLGGVTIGRCAVIAAGSVVTRDIPPYCVAAGVPCLVKKTWDQQGKHWVAQQAGKAA